MVWLCGRKERRARNIKRYRTGDRGYKNETLFARWSLAKGSISLLPWGLFSSSCSAFPLALI